MANTQRDGRNGGAGDGSANRPDRAAPLEGADRVPWRVDGARPSDGRSLQRSRLFGRRFWLLLLGRLTSVLGRATADQARGFPGGADPDRPQ
jgi:hypothetical protein